MSLNLFPTFSRVKYQIFNTGLPNRGNLSVKGSEPGLAGWQEASFAHKLPITQQLPQQKQLNVLFSQKTLSLQIQLIGKKIN